MAGRREASDDDIIYDWNLVGFDAPLTGEPVELLDETLHDGVQSPSVIDPDVHDKVALVRLMEALGIQYVDTGFPSAGRREREDVKRLCEAIRDEDLQIRPGAGARVDVDDVRTIVDIASETGVEIEVLTFVGSSPIRQIADAWDLAEMRRRTAAAVSTASHAGLPVTFVSEDAVRSAPKTLEPLFREALDAGASRLALCDTVGHATPDGIKALVTWTRELLDRLGAGHVRLDWHGHNDRGMALANTLFALQYGCQRAHATALGLGERVGNTAMDQLLVNLRLLGDIDHDLSSLQAYCRTASVATNHLIPRNYPVVGKDAFRTANGVHAEAILRARERGATRLADRIYSGVPASMVGKRQVIEIGNRSSRANAIAWLTDHGYIPTPELTEQVFQAAKDTNRTLHDDEVDAIVRRVMGAPGEC